MKSGFTHGHRIGRANYRGESSSGWCWPGPWSPDPLSCWPMSLPPCDCSLRTGTVRRSLRGLFGELEKEYPHIKENMLSAMGNVDTKRLLDPRLLEMEIAEPFPILSTRD